MSGTEELAFRKHLLMQRSAVQRQVLAVQVTQVLAPAVALAQQARAGQQWVRDHPALATGVAVAVGTAVAVWRPTQPERWSAWWRLLPQALALWQVWQRARSAQI